MQSMFRMEKGDPFMSNIPLDRVDSHHEKELYSETKRRLWQDIVFAGKD